MEEIVVSEKSNPGNGDSERFKVLICEDKSMGQKVIEFTLRGMGFETRVASDGEEGISLLKEEVVDLLVTDINMPFNSGLEILQFVRINFEHKIPVIIVSSINLDETKKHAVELGADCYLTKPFDPKELVSVVESLDILKK